MKKSTYSEEPIARALRQSEARAPIADISRKLGVLEQTYYLWRKKYGQIDAVEIRRQWWSEVCWVTLR